MGINPFDGGSYQVVLSNAFGMATSTVAQVVIHFVDAANSTSLSPYSTWATAATNIQDAIEASAANEFILVTNGVYGAGGKVVYADLTNRIVLDKPLVVQSMNGAAFTTIQGAWDPVTTNGPAAVRCAWVGDGAILDGFALTQGATRNAGEPMSLLSGGGIWGATSNAVVVNCVICTNAAAQNGGGAFQGFLRNCKLIGNLAVWGGGTYETIAVNSFLYANSARGNGGAAFNGQFANCTITRNWCGGAFVGQTSGGGIYTTAYGHAILRNCIVYNNSPYTTFSPNYSGSVIFSNSCTSPLPTGAGNINADPQWMDALHLASTSPCRGAGSAAYASGLDIDGEPWANPPSMGCDEVWEAAIKGPLSVTIITNSAPVVQGALTWFGGRVSGRASRVGWDFGDGTVQTNVSSLGVVHTWSTPGDYTVTFTAYNADNPNGVSTNLVIEVVPPTPPVLAVTPGTNTLTLIFSAQLNVRYVVEQATNISPPVTWQTVTTVIGLGGPLAVGAPTTNDMRFFRVRTQ